jgi:hypothetical protein
MRVAAHFAAARSDGFLMELAAHPTAAEIFEAANRVDPRCSRGTGFDNLRDLLRTSFAREAAVERRAKLFDVTGMRHQHSVCDSCAEVEDMKWCDVPRPASGPSVRGFIGNANSFSVGFVESSLPAGFPSSFVRVWIPDQCGARKARTAATTRMGQAERVRIPYQYFSESLKGS